jgi:hypothetical protein
MRVGVCMWVWVIVYVIFVCVGSWYRVVLWIALL